MTINLNEAAAQWRQNSPRVHGLAGKFMAIASGNSGVPSTTPLDDPNATELFHGDAAVLEFHNDMKNRFSSFGHHFISSIPYALQEWSRLGSALTMYLSDVSQQSGRHAYFHSVGSAEGVVARTIASLGNGSIYTLTNSSTPENRPEFFRKGAPETAFFFSGPYFEIYPAALQAANEITRHGYDVAADQASLINSLELAPFEKGFDVVFEDTCFQMHAPNRLEQVAWVCQNLRDDGLFVAWEKCSLSDLNEYQHREDMKDTAFKARYFSTGQVAEKKATILQRMETGQVPLQELVDGIAATLKHVVVTWNSGNFYIVVASNDPAKVGKFCSYMLPPCIEPQFQHMELPQTLHGHKLDLSFRQPSAGHTFPNRTNARLPQIGAVNREENAPAP